MNWLAVLMGITDPSGPWYLFWSGFGADLPIFGAGVTLYLRHNCHTPKCWRIGRHHNPADTTLYCRRHHTRNPIPEGNQ